MKFFREVESLLRRFFLNEAPYQEQGKYKTDFEELIRRAEERKGTKPFCPDCYITRQARITMQFRRSHIAGGDGAPLRDDQIWKCTRCYCFLGFGIPLTKKQFDEELQLRGGKHLFNPTARRDERHRQKISKRLVELGYLSFER